MLKNLERVLRDKNISKKSFAAILGLSESTIQNKLNGTTEFFYSEVVKTCELLPEYNVDYLMLSDSSERSSA